MYAPGSRHPMLYALAVVNHRRHGRGLLQQGLLCVNAIGNGHFDSALLSEWHGSNFASFSVLWYATRTAGKWGSCD